MAKVQLSVNREGYQEECKRRCALGLAYRA
jgi:hypothetical protein